MEKHPADILEEEETFEQTSEDLDRMIEQTRSVVIRRKGEEELEKELSKEEEWLVLYYRSFLESHQQEFIETIKTMARMTLQDDYR